MRELRQDSNHNVFLNQINCYLGIILVLMVACFFSWSENILVTRGIKLVGRLGLLFASFCIYRMIISYGAVDTIRMEKGFSYISYWVYLCLGFISFAWSTNVGYSALQWFMTTQTLFFCYFFVKSLILLESYFPNNKIRFFNLIGNSSFYIILVFIIGMWVNPDAFYRLTHGGEEARLGGYIMNPNELGMLAGVGIASLIFDLIRNYKRWITGLKLLILFYALYETGSRSSLVGVFLIIAYHIRLLSSVKIKVFFLALTLFISPVIINKIVLKGGDSNRIEEVMSLTGRLPFWTALINEGLPREPLLGFGFMRIDYKEYFQSTHTYPGKMTHNTFIQVLMNLGFIGLVIVIFQMLFTLIRILEHSKANRQFFFSLLIPLLVNSFTEFGIFGETNFGILFYQLIIIYISYKNISILTSIQKIHLRKRRPELFQTAV